MSGALIALMPALWHILKEYQNHQITQKEYLKKQRKNNSNILKKDALNSFYLYYLKIKNTQHKEIVNTKYTDCLRNR